MVHPHPPPEPGPASPILTLVRLNKAALTYGGRQPYPPDPGGGRAGLAVWGRDNTKGTRHGFVSSFPLPSTASQSWVGAAFPLGGMGVEVCVLRCRHYIWSSL